MTTLYLGCARPRSWAFPDRMLPEASREHVLEILKPTRGIIGGGDGASKQPDLPRTALIDKSRKLGIEALRSKAAHAAA